MWLVAGAAHAGKNLAEAKTANLKTAQQFDLVPDR